MPRELAAKWARRGIRVNAIAPGFPYAYDRKGSGDGSASDRIRRPMGRVGSEGELKGVVVFLASPASGTSRDRPSW